MLSSSQNLSNISLPIPSTYQIINPGDDCTTFSSTAKYMYIQDGSCNENTVTEFILSGMNNLEEVRIGKNCFKHAQSVVIQNLTSLKSLIFSSYSFNSNPQLIPPLHRLNSFLEITNCPSLSTIEFEMYSFGDFDRFHMSGMR